MRFTPKIIRNLKFALPIAGLCFLSICQAATDAAGVTLSRGRQILLDRGLQIQALAAWWGTPNQALVSRWENSNFTTINSWDDPGTSLALKAMPAGTNWSRMYRPGVEWTKTVSSAEMPYVNNLVSMQYSDEERTPDDAAVLADMTATYRQWNSLYPKALAYTNFGWDTPDNLASLQSYAQATKPDMLMFDCYPNFSTGERRDLWYSRMQMYRTAGLAGYTTGTGTNSGPIPYAQYLNLFRSVNSTTLPSESFIRLQQNVSWAFGYTFVTGFVYDGFSDPVLFTGNRGHTSPTPVYGYAAEANRQSLNLGPALVRMVSTDLRMITATTGTHQETYGTWPFYHTKTVDDDLALPDGISVWSKGTANTAGYTDYITGITPLGNDNGASHVHSDVFIGYFKPLLSNNSNGTFVDGLHFMIVNGAWGTPFAEGAAGDAASASAERFRLDFDFGGSDYDSLVRLSRDTGLVELVTLQHLTGGNGALYRLDLQLDGGTGDLFGFWDSSNPLPTIPEPSVYVLVITGLIGTSVYFGKKRR